MDPAGRMTCDELLEHSCFEHFRDWFQPELEVSVGGCSLVPRPCLKRFLGLGPGTGEEGQCVSGWGPTMQLIN